VKIIANLLVALIALLHLGFLVLEMFLWTTPFGLRTFNMTPEVAASSKVLAANQGLYNCFLAAGLVWGLLARENGTAIKVFFLACVLVAGIFGGPCAARRAYVAPRLAGAGYRARQCLSGSSPT
jgi:putative membrane protein